MKIQNIMTPDVESCGPQDNLSAAAMVMWRQDCGIVPVVDIERHVVGVITDRDICMAVATRHATPEDVRIADVMSSRLVTVRAHDDVSVALEKLGSERVHRLPVVDADGRLEGIVSINDLVMHTDPSARRGSELAAADVFKTIREICTHPVPVRTTPSETEKPEPQLAHAQC